MTFQFLRFVDHGNGTVAEFQTDPYTLTWYDHKGGTLEETCETAFYNRKSLEARAKSLSAEGFDNSEELLVLAMEWRA